MTRKRHNSGLGFTLVELIVAVTILLVLSAMAVPMARVTIKREKERQLRHALWEMRGAIDRYKDTADRGGFQIKVGNEGYPPDLDTLVNGVDVGGKKERFLRRIPIDPMTNGTNWGLRAMQDDPSSDSWNGENVLTCCWTPWKDGPSHRKLEAALHLFPRAAASARSLRPWWCA